MKYTELIIIFDLQQFFNVLYINLIIMKKVILIALLSFTCSIIYAQDYPVPAEYNMKEKEDYKPYEPIVKATIDWYLAQSLNSDPKKRQEANAFFMKWMTGTPDVSINLNLDMGLGEIIKQNAELMMPFIMGWAKYSLDNEYSKDGVLGYKAGMEALVAYYNKNKGFLKKDKNVEKYAKLIEKGKLEEEIRKTLEKAKK